MLRDFRISLVSCTMRVLSASPRTHPSPDCFYRSFSPALLSVLVGLVTNEIPETETTARAKAALLALARHHQIMGPGCKRATELPHPGARVPMPARVLRAQKGQLALVFSGTRARTARGTESSGQSGRTQARPGPGDRVLLLPAGHRPPGPPGGCGTPSRILG